MPSSFNKRLVLSVLTAVTVFSTHQGHTAEVEEIAAIDGPGKSGGGNSVNGKLLEQYRTKLEKSKYANEYQSLVVPRLEHFKSKLPRLGQHIIYSSMDLSWYFLPADLKKLKELRTGIPFNSRQDAVQQYKEVWVNTLNLDSLDPEARAYLFVHEMVLASLFPEKPEEINQTLMRKVRVTTDLIMKSELYTDKELAEELKSIWGNYTVYTATEKAKDDEQSRLDAAQLANRTRLQKEEEVKNWPYYKPVITRLFTAFRRYCENPASQYIKGAYYGEYTDLPRERKEEILKNYKALAAVIFPYAAYSGAISITSTYYSGISAQAILGRKIEGPMATYIQRDLNILFNNPKLEDSIPGYDELENAGFFNGYTIRNAYEHTQAMSKKCLEIQNIKTQLNQTLPEAIF